MQSILFLNGCILMLYGSGIGFPFWIKLVNRPANGEGMRVAHSAIIMGGIAIIAISAAYEMIVLSPLLQKVLVAGILCTGYGFGVSTSIYAYTGRRGLTFKWGLDGIAFTFMSLGALGGTVAGAMLLYNVFRTLTG